MDAVKFLGEFNRMCKTYKNCESCPAKEECNYIVLATDENRQWLVDVVEQWSKDHPQKTRLQDLLEKYPNAPMEVDGTPKVCCENLGYYKACDESGANCKKCWNMPMEE